MTDNDDMTDNEDIVDVLREWASANGGYVTVASDLLANAAHEIERLRRLITEWADADAAMWGPEEEKGPWGPEEMGAASDRLVQASQALVKAVGR